MHERHYISPQRCARGQVTVGALAANFSVASLFHNGSGQFLLALRYVFIQAGGSAQFNAGVAQGAIGTLSMTGVPVITGAAALPGQIFSSQQAGQGGTVDTLWGNSNTWGTVWTPEVPYCVLTPGMSFWINPIVANMQIAVTFFWEAVYRANILPPDDENLERLEAGQ